MLNQAEELKIALSARDGDKDSFALLYDTYIKKIYDFIYYKTWSKETAEDLVSQVFLKALQNISKFKSDNFAAWLYTIARNVIIDYYRCTKETKNIEDCWDLASDDNLIDNAHNNLNLEKIKKAMKELSVSDRDLLIMRLWLDLPFKEIANNLEKSEAAAKVSFGRALSRLREKIPLSLFLLIPLLTICKKLN